MQRFSCQSERLKAANRGSTREKGNMDEHRGKGFALLNLSVILLSYAFSKISWGIHGFDMNSALEAICAPGFGCLA